MDEGHLWQMTLRLLSKPTSSIPFKENVLFISNTYSYLSLLLSWWILSLLPNYPYSYIWMVLSSCFLQKSRKDEIIWLEKRLASATKIPLLIKSGNRIFSKSYYTYSTVLSILTCQSYPTRLGWFLFLILCSMGLCLTPVPHTYSPTPLLHFPHRSYPFPCYGRG
jgi:CDP-diglyceride synthetase